MDLVVVLSSYGTQSFTTPLFGILTQAQCVRNIILEFSPSGLFAVVGMQKDNTVTVLNLKSGAPQLTMDAKMEVFGLGLIRNTVVVIGARNVTAWVP